jgi:hypothetical protein
MVTAYCPRHGSRVLLSERRIRALHHTETGIVMELECYDGERVFVVTGRDAPSDPAAARQLVMSVVAERHRAAGPKAVA